MALTSAQKIKIIRLLGYPYGTLEETSLDYSRIISRRMTDLAGDAQTEVLALVTKLDAIDAQLDSKISQAGVKRIDDIEFYEGSHSVLKSEKSRVLADLAALIGIPLVRGGSTMGSVCV